MKISVLAAAALAVFLAAFFTTAEAAGAVRPVAIFETSMWNFKIELFYDLAPKTCRSFMDLAERNFYDGTIFHRVIYDFMIQCGDPTGTGSGGPGYTIPDEFGPGLTHDAEGILSMANAGRNSHGGQFFITLVKAPWLDGRHVARVFDHADHGAVARPVPADGAGVGVRQVAADGAVFHPPLRFAYRVGDSVSVAVVHGEDVKGQPLRAFAADSGQPGERADQIVQRFCVIF